MRLSRVQDVLNNKEKVDIFYDERPVWIQGINDNVAKVGFIDNFEERDVYIEDLYEKDLYNSYDLIDISKDTDKEIEVNDFIKREILEKE